MDLRTQFTDALKQAMLARDAARTSTLRMILAKLKDTDIESRPSGVDKIPDEAIRQMLRGMIKSRRDSVALYKQGHRQELADKEEAEIAVINSFLPRQMDAEAADAAIRAAIAETGATGIKEMGKVMAALKAKYADTLDMGAAGPRVRALLAG
jgi:uncharacterized protein YqeY